MTEFADYYCAVRHLSRTLATAFLSSPAFVQQIQDHHFDILPLAAKLRHAVLFRECLFWLVSDWTRANGNVAKIKGRKLQKIAQNAFNAVAAKVSRVQHRMMAEIWQSPEKSSRAVQSIKHVKTTVYDARSSSKVVCLPSILASVRSDGLAWPANCRELVGDLLRNHSVLVHTDCIPGTGEMSNRLLCAVVDDEDLPWDVKEEDW